MALGILVRLGSGLLVSNGRRFRRQQKPPAHVLDTFASQECPDCDSELSVQWRDGHWAGAIAHDPGCIQMAWRERHGATSSFMITAEPGKTVPADLVAEVVGILKEQTGCVGVRVSDRAALSRSERERIDWAN